jgi:hypothetical protein
MWQAWNRRSTDRRLETRLRTARPQAHEELVRTISGAVESSGQPRAWSRMAFAAAFTTLVLGMFASFGGISYAASGAASAAHTLTKITAAKKLVVAHSSAASQYTTPPPTQPTGGNAGQTQGAGTVNAVAGAEASQLPFTGISLLVTMVLGLALIGTGLTLRKRERQKS